MLLILLPCTLSPSLPPWCKTKVSKFRELGVQKNELVPTPPQRAFSLLWLSMWLYGQKCPLERRETQHSNWCGGIILD